MWLRVRPSITSDLIFDQLACALVYFMHHVAVELAKTTNLLAPTYCLKLCLTPLVSTIHPGLAPR